MVMMLDFNLTIPGQTDEYAVKVQGVEILPDPVVRGKPATFNISASTGTMLMYRTKYINSQPLSHQNRLLLLTIKDKHSNPHI
ncbi:MD-2-related lipid recognition domain-containing protein / ML domain-containing protein [Prunus dulcis]|uniref:MD-2-related lipid recognition domain-containing protein / ML domain-containing protein n=1 Tax=Prunus dulcis TaxID=3755 RepID=A0A5H2XZA9_PRUDU|nr:MD-2-related lipid recognition domain-containing protein / ML domain-containing protein [Prunus dulcis]